MRTTKSGGSVRWVAAKERFLRSDVGIANGLRSKYLTVAKKIKTKIKRNYVWETISQDIKNFTKKVSGRVNEVDKWKTSFSH